jgi:hypothetical protein
MASEEDEKRSLSFGPTSKPKSSSASSIVPSIGNNWGIEQPEQDPPNETHWKSLSQILVSFCLTFNTWYHRFPGPPKASWTDKNRQGTDQLLRRVSNVLCHYWRSRKGDAEPAVMDRICAGISDLSHTCCHWSALRSRPRSFFDLRGIFLSGVWYDDDKFGPRLLAGLVEPRLLHRSWAWMSIHCRCRTGLAYIQAEAMDGDRNRTEWRQCW